MYVYARHSTKKCPKKKEEFFSSSLLRVTAPLPRHCEQSEAIHAMELDRHARDLARDDENAPSLQITGLPRLLSVGSQ